MWCQGWQALAPLSFLTLTDLGHNRLGEGKVYCMTRGTEGSTVLLRTSGIRMKRQGCAAENWRDVKIKTITAPIQANALLLDAILKDSEEFWQPWISHLNGRDLMNELNDRT